MKINIISKIKIYNYNNLLKNQLINKKSKINLILLHTFNKALFKLIIIKKQIKQKTLILACKYNQNYQQLKIY